MDSSYSLIILLSSIFSNIISQYISKTIFKSSFLSSIKIGLFFGLLLLFLLTLIYDIKIQFFLEIIFLFILASYSYIVIINTPESSIRLKILFLIYKYKITEKKLFNRYNNVEMFNLRISKLINSKTIGVKNNKLFIINKKIIILFYVFKILKRLYLGNKSRL